MNRGMIPVILVLGLVSTRVCAGGDDQPAAAALLEWNQVLLEAVRKQNSPPGLAARNLAILHIAIFDALNAPVRKYRPFAFDEPSSPVAGGDLGVICGAAHQCALLLYPTERARFNRLFTKYESTGGEVFNAGVRIGTRSAKAIIAMRADDGASRNVTYVPSNEAGLWRRTPPKFRPPELPHWNGVRPFVLKEAGQFRPPPPPAMATAVYQEGWEEVKELGARVSNSRTADETEIAKFWSCFNYTATPAGHWNDIARKVIDSSCYCTLDLARCYALLNVAMADAGIAAWDCKYHYRFWRPIQAIAHADRDGNDGTVAVKNWVSMLEAPPHPEYVSGHSTFTGAGESVIRSILGRDDVEFEITSESLPGVVRKYKSLSACADEIGRSRIYGGIHFPWSNTEGLALGRKVGRQVITRCCLPY